MSRFNKQLSLVVVLALCLTSFLSISPAQAQDVPELQVSSNSDTLGEIIPGQVLVKYKTSRPRADSFGAQSISPFVQKLTFSESISVADKINELKLDPNVEYAEPVYKVHLIGQVKDGTVAQSVYYNGDNMNYMENWGKTVTQLTYAAALTNPNLLKVVKVAVLDTGIDSTHPDLVGSIVPGYDFINNTYTPQDGNGHGTHVAGIIAAQAANPDGYTGVAPGVKIMPLKVLNNAGEGTTADLVAAIKYATSHGARVINMSLGSYGSSKLVHDAIKEAIAANILVVAAAGNDGNNWINTESAQLDDNPTTDKVRYTALTSYPALYDEVISVGALVQLSDTTLTVADFSNTMKVDVAAPGVNIYSTAIPTTQNPTRYAVKHGTSQATPFVSALAALIVANDPDITVNNLRAVIENSAHSVNNLSMAFSDVLREGSAYLYPSDFYGRGIIDGKDSFTKSRLEFSLDTSSVSTQNSVTISVYEKDGFGALVAGTDSYNLTINQIYENSPFRFTQGPDDLLSNTVTFNVYNGYGSKTVTLPTMKDVFGYRLYVDDTSVDRSLKSNAIEWFRRPVTPQPDKAAGQYTSSVAVQLSSSTPNATLEYILLNSDNNDNAYPYSAPISINKSGRLLTVALKNRIYSDTGEYIYTIVQPPAPPVIGGGGFFPMPPAKEEAKPGVVKPNAEELLKQIDTATGPNVKVNVEVDKTAKEWTIELTGQLIQKALEKQKSLELQANGVLLILPPGAIAVKDDKATVQLKSTIHADAASSGTTIASHTQLSSPIYDLSLLVNENKVTTFDKPLRVTLAYDGTKVKDSGKLAVYYYDETTKQWQYVGGTVNKDNTISVDLSHFSKYAVMESTRTFDDITTHWAKREIENMAARRIVEGITDELFEPEQSVTRAQFVTLLSRALNLSEGEPAENKFTDVGRNEWYSSFVYAAYRANIVSGVDDSSFAPDAQITREQMATLMVNAYLYKNNKKLSDIVITQEVKYSDEGSVSDWARSSVRTATALGLMSGDEQDKFNPLDRTSRAQAAVVIYRLLNK